MCLQEEKGIVGPTEICFLPPDHIAPDLCDDMTPPALGT